MEEARVGLAGQDPHQRRRPETERRAAARAIEGQRIERLAASQTSFLTAATWPETQRRFQALFDRGLNEPGDMENRYGELLGSILK